jgi:adenylate cyclase class 2
LSTETEVKVKIEDPGDFCRRLAILNPGILSDRHLEDNYLLDFPDGRLGSSQSLLRIRFAAGRNFLTYKGAPRPQGSFKVREELETTVENGQILLEALGRIGMRVWFRYQKYRQEFSMGETHVTVDETPIGNYAEIEGSESGIRDLAHRMSIAETQFLRSSYYSLYLEHCREQGIAPGHMVFW